MSGLPAGAGALLGKRLGKYEVLALLALGGTAEIYLARIGGAAGFEKYVVIKCLHDHLADDPEFIKMFLDEARLAAMLDHSNIVQTFELGEHERRYYMVMEYLAGLSLAMIVRRAAERLPGGKLPVALVLNIAAQACAGLHYAHDRQANGKPLNMVHRDISPQNLVIGFEGVVKVVDFGIARAELRETKTKAGTIKGKFAYMSPEQCVAANVDRRTDVFALGVIVWELLTGRRLFKRNSPYETYQAVLECAVGVPSSFQHELDPALDDVVMKAVAKTKEDRYPSAEAFGDVMLGYLHQRGKSSGPAEVGRFLEEQFAQELEEHGERMRELIGSHDPSKDSGVGWGDDDDRANKTVDLSGKGAQLESGDLVALRPSDASLEELVAELPPAEASDLPAEKTRIEANPLDAADPSSDSNPAWEGGTIVELDGPRSMPGHEAVDEPAPLAAPPTVALRPSHPGGFVPAAVAEPDLAPVRQAAAQQRTELEPPVAPENTPTVLSDDPLTLPLHDSHRVRVDHAPLLQQAASPYPVVQGGRPVSSDLAPSNLPPPQRSPYSGEQVSPMAAPHAPPMPAPHAPPMAAPHVPPISGPPHMPHPASAVAPSGDQPARRDWSVAEAQPVRAIPPWMLAVLFVSAVSVALTITIVIARILR
jgi:serine/threonine-protein kinase